MTQPAETQVTVQDAQSDVGQVRLHYRLWQRAAGADERLPPILLIHGLASASRIWDLTAPALARRGHRVVALDQRGHGESDKPDSGYSFAQIVGEDHALAAALGLARPVVVGHSWGGSVAVQYAASYPTETHALVLVDGGFSQMSARPGWTKERMLKDLAPPQFAGTPAETFVGYVRRGELAKVWSPALEDALLHIVELRADGTVAPRLSLANHLQILDAMWDQPTLSLYDQIACPILIVCPEQEPTDDRMRQFLQSKHESIARLKEAHPAIRVEYLPNTVHDVPLQQPETLAGLISEISQAG